jgi:hypothetical protein
MDLTKMDLRCHLVPCLDVEFTKDQSKMMNPTVRDIQIDVPNKKLQSNAFIS